MSFKVPDLSYDYSALEPYIDEETMRFHHDKHHAAYVNMLNGAVEAAGNLGKKTVKELIADLDAVPEAQRGAVRNHGGGHFNHAMFWEIMGPGSGEMSSELNSALLEAFESLDNFKAEFHKAGMTRFGSGWAWLCSSKGKLSVCSTANQDNPLMGEKYGGCDGKTPILGCDVWEHAYYLNYQNLRGDYITAFFNVINWAEVSRRYSETL
ncbi:MAG: superoxide dismutase [Candidatus Thermoplasmatota archaeon]|nr:superoxide dismutase [Candidatus Thermoplasmatota archaeon]